MSMGSFGEYLYESDDGYIYYIRLQQETVELSPTAPSGVSMEYHIRVAAPRNGFGIHPRYVEGEFTDPADAPAGYLVGSTLTVVILTPADYVAIAPGSLVTYNGSASFKITSKKGERKV